jgi:TolB protein
MNAKFTVRESSMEMKKIVEFACLALAVTALFCELSQISLHAASEADRGQQAPSAIGIFEKHGDIGGVLHSGSAVYDAAKETYTLAGSGENMWFASDEFQFSWTPMSGDVALTADISFLGQVGNPHHKAVLMIRQSLDTDSVYADVALHGDGLTSLQYRGEKGAATHELQSNISAPKRLRIEKRGPYFTIWLAGKDGEFRVAAGSVKVTLNEPFFVGIGVCSHDKNVTEKAVFSKVQLAHLGPLPAEQTELVSTLETVAIASTDRRVVYATTGRVEAPNWTHDGATMLFNRNGRIERLPATGGSPQLIDTGFATRCNNDHGISPDGEWLVLSDQSQDPHQSIIYILPFAGGSPRRITEKYPSYWHGWSPDGTTLAFVGQREGEFDIYSISAAGGDEKRLTTAKGLDDGPEYSPDGKYIYFNSERTGKMEIWRMRPDGSEQEQVTSDEYNNWFPHLSPDGTQMVILSYNGDVKGHPENKDVMLRLMSLKDRKITVLARLFGGQGTINVPSWSPDGSKVAFVSYMLVPKGSSAAAPK